MSRALRVSTRALFDRDAAAYFAEKYGDGSGPRQYAFAVRLARVAEFLGERPGRVLDVGCGPGVLIEAVAGRGGHLTGVDLSPAMLAQARDRARRLGLVDRCRFEEGSAEALPFPDRAFDAVTAMGVLEYIHDDVRALAEMARVVRPAGAVIVTVPNLVSPWRLLPVVLKPPLLRFLRPAYQAVRRRLVEPEACELDRFPRRLYTPWGLWRRLGRVGLRPVQGLFYNVRLPVLGSLCRRGSLRLTMALEPLGRAAGLGWLGGGYVVKARCPGGRACASGRSRSPGDRAWEGWRREVGG